MLLVRMTARPLVALLALTTLAFAPSAGAADPCVAEAGATDLGPVIVAGDLSVWQDNNGVEGLQRSSCGEDENGRPLARGDTRVA